MKRYIYKAAVVATSMSIFTACDLDEFNPSEVSLDKTLQSEEGLAGMQALCYQPIYGQLYSVFDFMSMAECGTDIWWCKNNVANIEQMFYYEGLTPTTNKPWDKAFTQMYAALGLCNTIIEAGANTDNQHMKTMVAEAYYLRAFYHLMLTTYYGPITLVLAPPSESPVLKPSRNTLSEIYGQIVSDLNYAVTNLGVMPLDGNRARATKKSAKGLLCRAYIQGAGQGLSENGKSYWERAKEEAEDFIANANSYGAMLYDDISVLWADANNRNNAEALFVAAGQDACQDTELYNNSSSFSNKLFTYCYCNMENTSPLSLIDDAKNDPLYGRCNNNLLAPSEYLLKVFNPTWDKRWENSFQTAYFGFSQTRGNGTVKSYSASQVKIGKKASQATAWSKWGIDQAMGGEIIYPYVDLEADTAFKAGGAQYTAMVWPKGDNTGDNTKLETVKKIYVVDYPLAADDNRFFLYFYPSWADEYKNGYDRTGRVYCSVDIEDLFKTHESGYRCYVENGNDLNANNSLFPADSKLSGMRPSLNKFIWNYKGVYYDSNKQIRNGDMFVMRMAEIYLIAAEAEQHLGNGTKAADYINTLRRRAARSTATEADWKLASATEDDIFDEYARELCGEFQRWALLQRHGALKDRLQKYNGRAAKSFEDHMVWRPISATFLQQIENTEEYGDNGYHTTRSSGLDGYLR